MISIVKSAPPTGLGNNNNLALRSFAELRLPRYEYAQRAWSSNSNIALRNLAQVRMPRCEYTLSQNQGYPDYRVSINR